jgi:type IV pilus assembly protein PilM
MEKPDSPELEVGIFAIKNELINSILEPFQLENLKVTTVQMGPMSLYNYACHEFKELDPEGTKAVVIVNMGTENTELVICSKTKVWQRVIPIGGNNFTNAIAEAFKLNFEKAEKLKRTAPMSKYAKQIFHAMRPVFTDMASEIQRSVGYFATSSRGVKFVKVVALGGAMKLQGVTKYLQQFQRHRFTKMFRIWASLTGLGFRVLGWRKCRAIFCPAESQGRWHGQERLR